MRRRPIVVSLVPPLLAVVITTTLAASWWAGASLRAFHLRQTEERLRNENAFIQTLLATDRFDAYDARTAADLIRSVRQIAPATRVTLIDADGRVLGDSMADPTRMPLHHGRPEFAAALAGRVGRDHRLSDTTGFMTLYVAQPVWHGSRIVGAVRTAVSVDHIEAAIGSLRRRLLLLGGGMAAAITGAALLLAWKLAAPMSDLARAARRLAAGDFAHRIETPPLREIAEVGEAMNFMAAELAARIETSEAQQREMATLLQSLSEGVLAIDNDQRLLFANERAAELLGAGIRWRRGMDLRACVRVVPFQELLLSVLQEPRTAETTALVSNGAEDRYMHGRASPLPSAGDSSGGAVIVLNDLTDLHRLMNLRREFVANVSHELKTPLTSIRGFLEMLLDPHPPTGENRRRFLEIALRQTQRLQTLVDDLLSLSRIEQLTEQAGLRVAEVRAAEITADAVEVCSALSAERGVRVETRVPEDLSLRADGELLSRALVNLLDNAIKHSPRGAAVTVTCQTDGADACWTVEDVGPGIEAKHLPRIFERFYRVDKARSRRDGGTGLGLTIAKHIVAAHGGRIGVESDVGRGSRFWFRVPRGGAAPSANGHTANPNATPTFR